MKQSFTISHKNFGESVMKKFLRSLSIVERDNLDIWLTETNIDLEEEKLSMEDFMKAKKALEKANVPMTDFYVSEEYAFNMFTPTYTSLVPLSYGTTPEGCCGTAPTPKEKEKKMYNFDTDCCNSAPANPELVAKDYLVGRLFDAKDRKYSAAYEAFGLTIDNRPTTPKDLVERITSGKFVIKTDMEIYKTHYPMDCIEWRDPAIKKDRPGFEAWEKLLNTAHLAAKDQIMIGTPADGLKALQAFEASTIQ